MNLARRYYIAAAERGHAKAMHNLAVLYAEGIDGKPDYKTAAEWFRRASEFGIADSQYNLGILLARGIGIEQNMTESYKWFALAALQGDRDAAKKRDDVGAKLDAGSLASARAAVQSFTAQPQPDDAISVQTPPGGWDKPAADNAPARKPRAGSVARVNALLTLIGKAQIPLHFIRPDPCKSVRMGQTRRHSAAARRIIAASCQSGPKGP